MHNLVSVPYRMGPKKFRDAGARSPRVIMPNLVVSRQLVRAYLQVSAGKICVRL